MRFVSSVGRSVVLLLAGLLTLYLVFLVAKASQAQESTMMESTMMESTAVDPDGECTGAQEVASIGPETESQQEEFSVDGDSFRVSYDATINDDSGSILFGVENEFGLFDFERVFESGSGEFIVLEGPDTFNLAVEVDARDASYTVTVEDCAGATDEDTGNDGVIDDTIPDKDLPDTSGSTALIVGGSALLLLYGGLVAWRLKTRER